MNVWRVSVDLLRDGQGRVVADPPEWMRPDCGCHIVVLGPLAITWHGRECRCDACGGYVCKCANHES